MKVILSRKGFDSSFGRYPSPIMPDGSLLSLPIPVTQEGEQGIPYGNLIFDGQPISEIIDQLSDHQFNYQNAHLDPDLDETRFIPRPNGWLPIFGQTGRSQSHLEKQRVAEGDLFLFYGWFRRVDNAMHYARPRKDLHVIFGWLQIGCSYNVNEQFEDLPPWVNYHPHVINRDLYHHLYHHNKIYIPSEQLSLPGKNLHLPGGGTCPRFKDILQLTDPDEQSNRRSYWRLPQWFYPFGNPPRTPLSYHPDLRRWELHNDHVILKTKSPGQEFVFNTDEYPEAMAISWVRSLFEDE